MVSEPAPSTNRESAVAEALISLAEALVGPVDPLEFLHVVSRHCVELLECAEAGMLVTADGEAGSLRVVGSSSERAEALETLQSLNQLGPCVECLTCGELVISEDLRRDRGKWPLFAPQALARGVRAVHSLPMRWRGESLGVLNLFRDRPGRLSPDDARVAQGLADLAAIGLLHERTTRQNEAVVSQLEAALESRVVIEQAKGIVAATLGVSVEEAFGLIRRRARDRNRLLSEIARELVDESLAPQDLAIREGRVRSSL